MFITINDTRLTPDTDELYRLDVLFIDLDTDEFRQKCTLASREQYFPERYLQSNSARAIAGAVMDKGRKAYVVEYGKRVSVCLELLLDYVHRYSADVFVDFIQQLRLEMPMAMATDLSVAKPDESFWHVFHELNADIDMPFNHSNAPQTELAINLTQVIQHCYDNNVKLPPRRIIIKQLHKDKYYMGNLVVRSRLTAIPMHCFVFATE